MRKVLLVAAAAALLGGAFTATSASAEECIQWPNPFGWDQIEVCHTLPGDIVKPES